jgi:excisionase family DNA binding protein
MASVGTGVDHAPPPTLCRPQEFTKGCRPVPTAAIASPEFQQLLFTIDQAALILGATPWAVRRLIYAGELPYKRVGKRNVIPRMALEQLAGRDLVCEGAQIGKRK